MKTDTVRAKVSYATKVSAERILHRLGLTMSEAINLMLVQIKLRKALPFNVVIPSHPNAQTRRAISDAKNNRNLKTYNTLNELFEDLSD